MCTGELVGGGLVYSVTVLVAGIVGFAVSLPCEYIPLCSVCTGELVGGGLVHSVTVLVAALWALLSACPVNKFLCVQESWWAEVLLTQ